jgi:23S rRNA (uracil1939-C5)-methyltransferase
MDPVVVASIDHEGRGVARSGGKVVFIDGALPGERVTYAIRAHRSSFDSAQVVRVVDESPWRTTPHCPHFGICGGCSLQHLDFDAQVAVKQRTLEDNLWHIGRVRAGEILAAVRGPAWGYRHRARLSARYVASKGGALVGFREKRSSFVADLRSCEVLAPPVSNLIVPLRELVDGLSIRERMPQVEVAVGDDVAVLVFRVLQPPNEHDEALLRAFADRYAVQVWLQPRGPDSAWLFHPPGAPELAYSLPEFGVRFAFQPTEFTQVNLAVNRVLVTRTVALLEPKPGERIADFFCGLGNFALPMASRGASVVGYEGSPALVARARECALHNGLSANASFCEANLFQVTDAWLAGEGGFDKWLVDPPRDGAIELVKALPQSGAPGRIAYVACNPATLARDAGVLVHVKGYRLAAAGIVNMFPHTSHVESVALFQRP